MDIYKLQAEVWKIADQCGWHEGRPLEFGEFVALCHSELSEALEIYRVKGSIGITTVEGGETLEHMTAGKPDVEKYLLSKPEGIPIELGDVVMRILDYCESKGINLQEAMETKMKFNKTRPRRHGGKVI